VPFVDRPDGVRLFYDSTGDGPPLVLLEGMGGDIPGWRRNIPTLATRHRVVAYDHRGNGRSPMPDEPVTMDVFVEDAIAMIDATGAERAHLYGQSFGGMVALEAALTHPDRVRSLVLACTNAGPRRATHSPVRAAKSRPYELLYSERFPREHPDHVAEDLRVGSQTPQQPHARRRQWEAMQDWDAWDRLVAITCPTLILHGTEDRLVPVENARRMAARIPGAKLALLEGAGHLYHSEQPDAADTAVLAFLDEVEARV
jgi:pimeloyl-ACP methyl ester carboxylesterase